MNVPNPAVPCSKARTADHALPYHHDFRHGERFNTASKTALNKTSEPGTSGMDFIRIAAFVPVATILVLLTANPLSPLAWLLPEVWQFCTSSIAAGNTFLAQLSQGRNTWFCTLLFLRYGRFFGNCFARYCLYAPTPIPKKPTFTARNVHVVLPTIDPKNVAFRTCLKSILKHQPRWLTVVCGGEQLVEPALKTVQGVKATLGLACVTHIQVDHTESGNKRKQMRRVLDRLAANEVANKDTIVVFVDDHIWWEGDNFLAHLLAPFENPNIGLVGTKKHVARTFEITDPVTGAKQGSRWSKNSLINYIACVYLERHNWECSTSNAVDGGVFVISARTMAIRAPIVLKEDFRQGLTEEYFHYYFAKAGPLNPDDDNYITRYVVNNKIGIKFQNDLEDKMFMYTTLGINGWGKLQGQLKRWARTQWRSNITSLTYPKIWLRHPWTALTVYSNWLTNFAALWDSMIIYAWWRSSFENFHLYHLIALILLSKVTKQFEYLCRNPRDWYLFFFYLAFAYYHSWIKIMTLFTCWDISWSGRMSNADGTVVSPVDSHNGESQGLEGYKQDRQGRVRVLPPFIRGMSYTRPSSQTQAEIQEFAQPRARVSDSISIQLSEVGSSSPRSRAPDSGSASTDPTVCTIYAPTPVASDQPGMSDHSGISPGRSHTRLMQNFSLAPPERQTPWGRTRSPSPHLTPANVMESQYKSASDKRYSLRSSSLGKGSSPPRKTTPGPVTPLELRNPSPSTPAAPRGRKKSSLPPVELGRTRSGGFRVPSLPTSSSSRNTSLNNNSLRSSLSEFPIPELGVASPPQTPLQQPYQSDVYEYNQGNAHATHDCEEYCNKPHMKEENVIKPERYVSPPMPSPPDLGPRIKIRGSSPFDKTKTSRWSSYDRDFPRCYEDERVHVDGSFLTAPRSSIGGRRRCRSPSRSPDPPVAGRPRL